MYSSSLHSVVTKGYAYLSALLLLILTPITSYATTVNLIHNNSINSITTASVNNHTNTANVESEVTESYIIPAQTESAVTESYIIPAQTESETTESYQPPINVAAAAQNDDPLENFNRNSYRMNATLDRNFVRPATVAYITYVPNLVRTGVQNFFNNLRDFVTVGNDILQLNGMRAVKDTLRIGINSTFGLLGFIDIASYSGLPEHLNTFGKTMMFYGWTNSSYLMIPLIGPSTVRDAIGMIPDLFFNPTWYVIPTKYVYISIGLFMANGIDQRSKFLQFDQVLDTSLDPYMTVRDFYLQSSGNIVTESSPPVEINSLLDSEN